MNIVLFTGGSGNANLIKYLRDLSYVNLSLLINGYDDGLSTGTIRSANYGMLGPSDFRKNFTYILDTFSKSSLNIKNIFNHRLALYECRLLLEDPELLFEHLLENKTPSHNTKEFIKPYFITGANKLLSYTKKIEQLTDFSVGNIIIGGLYEVHKDFNKSLNVLTDYFNLNAKLINVSDKDDSKLVAFNQSSDLLENEADIVNYNGTKPLKEFYLLPLKKFNTLDSSKNYSPDEIKLFASVPEISVKARHFKG